MQKGKTNTKLPRTIYVYIRHNYTEKRTRLQSAAGKTQVAKLPREKVVLLALLRQQKQQQQQLRKREPIGELEVELSLFAESFTGVVIWQPICEKN